MKKLLGYTLFAIVFLLIGMLLADTKVAEVARTTATVDGLRESCV